MSYELADTIYALSSGAGKGGVAVLRLSGDKALSVAQALTGQVDFEPRYAYFKTLRRADGIALDQSVVIYFKAPHSFTGEDVVEFHVHGGRGVIESVFDAFAAFDGVRPAERGEYSRRAVINGKMDLTAAEGLMDLIDAQTEQQRRLALTQLEGRLGALYDGWRGDLKRDMAYLEAFIDFPEEEIPPEKEAEIDENVRALLTKIETHLNDNERGQRLRDGFQIALVGVPNAGKSSLMNALTERDVAIVSQTAGTTRDVVEAHLDVAGFPVILADTAGLREDSGEIEAEGIRRAVRKAEESDLILHVRDLSNPVADELPETLKSVPVLTVWNKSDKTQERPETGFVISAKNNIGISELWNKIKAILKENLTPPTDGIITRARYRTALKECAACLARSLHVAELELKAEELRLAARALGRITGRIETDELLDVIFRDFCIGK